jgi:hypothetical protein
MQNDPYRLVINDLQVRWDRRIEELKIQDSELKSIALALKGLQALMGSGNSASAPDSQPQPPHSNAPYAGISVRWAILYLLAEHTTEAMATGQIAKALLAGGIVTKGANFAANVSAVIGGMVRTRKEVEDTGSGYQLTTTGREMWMGIKESPQMKLRMSTPEEPED